MATEAQCNSFISTIAPIVQKYAAQYGIRICSFIIAQACFESGYGTSNAAIRKNNILGIGPGIVFNSWDECIQGYFTRTRLGKSQAAKNATNLDEYAQAFTASGYLGDDDPNTPAQYIGYLRSIINRFNLTQYDNGATVSSSNKLQEFLAEAEKHLGETYEDWVRGVLGKSGHEAWCADFVWACAKTVGIEGIVISGCAGAHLTIDHTAEKCGGIIYDGSSSYNPQPGDLINFVWHGGTWANHIGIVTDFKDGVVYTIEGNASNQVKHKQYNRNSSVILRFCHPNWSKVGGFAAGLYGNLYQESNTREDAIVREVAYYNYQQKEISKRATVDTTLVKLSLVNYTDLFTAFWDAGKSQLGATSEYNLDGLESNVRAVVQYLTNKGLNNAAACGICGNIYYESNFDTSGVGDKGTSFGICQWHLGRGAAMKQMAGDNWANNLTGQLDYLWYELTTSYKSSTLDPLKSVSNTAAGAKQAADIFVRKFERPARVDSESVKRQAKAEEYFNKIVTTVKTASNSGFSSINFGNISVVRQKILTAAQSQLGVPYVWGGTTPGVGLDCSGFTQYCYSQVGISIPRTSGAQYSGAYSRVSPSQAEPGDILWSSGHVRIYAGDNQYIHAPHTGDVVKFASGISSSWVALKYI